MQQKPNVYSTAWYIKKKIPQQDLNFGVFQV